MRSFVVLIAIAGAGGLASSAGCERRESGTLAPPPVVETAAPIPTPPPSPPPPPPSPPAGDGGPTDATAADGGEAGGTAAAGGSKPHRGAPSPGTGGGSRGAIGKVKVQGSLARGEVERVLRDGVPRLKACRGGAAGGKGQVDLELTIGEQGWATLAEVKRTTLSAADPELCIVKTLRALRFPKPSDGKDTTVSFALQLR